MKEKPPGTRSGWGVIAMLAAAQFIMVLDTTVMNVSITQVAADLNTTIVGLQTAITLYTLVMAAFMLIGGKLGDRWGAKRAFTVGLLVYGAGSLTTALSPSLPVLLVGWSFIEVSAPSWSSPPLPRSRPLPTPAESALWLTASSAASAERPSPLVR